MTLRPLFRRVLGLGGDTSQGKSYGISSTTAKDRFGTKLRGSRKDGKDDGYEMDPHNEPASRGYANGMTLTEVLGGNKLDREEDVSSFETESQKKILRDGSDMAKRGDANMQPLQGIMVTTHVNLTHDESRHHDKTPSF
jgi:hypothetical protein